MTGEHGRTWKPHQYVALMFAEHYLNRYFENPTALGVDLNLYRERDHLTSSMPEYHPDELRTVAFQSATGSGKDPADARQHPAIPTLSGTSGRAPQQRGAGDTERADVRTA